MNVNNRHAMKPQTFRHFARVTMALSFHGGCLGAEIRASICKK